MLVLLLVTWVTGEWVEISQHYRHGEPLRRAPAGFQGAAEIYANNSLTEHAWHRSGLPRITNFGSVRRVQLQSKDKLTFSVGGLPDSTRTKTMAVDRGYESIGTVKEPNMKKENVPTDKVKRKPNVDHFGTVNVTDVSIHNPLIIEKTILERPRVLYANNHISKQNKYQEILINDDEYNNNESKNNYKSLEVNRDIKHVQSGSEIGIPNEVLIANKPLINVTQYSEESEHNVKSNPGGRSRNNNATYKTRNNEDLGSPAHTTYPSTPTVEHTTEEYFNKNLDIKIQNPTEKPKSQQRIKDNTGNDGYTDPKPADRKDVDSDGGTMTNTVQVIWKLMKIVTDNISRNTRRSFRSKVRYLEDLQNNIVANIAERIDLAWPDDVAAGAESEGARRRRAAEARGHVEFPSSESALMTISFLTFAVFLIKLVLQVIHTYKNKTMMVTPAVVAAVGRAGAASLRKQIHR